VNFRLRKSVSLILALILLLTFHIMPIHGQGGGEPDSYEEPANDPRQPEFIWSVAWSPDGNSIAMGIGAEICAQSNNDYSVRVLNLQTGFISKTLSYHRCSVTALDWSPDGSKLVTTSGTEGGSIIWDVGLAQPISYFQSRTMPGFIDNVWNPNPNYNSIASISETDPNITIWNPINGHITFSFNSNFPTSITWSPNGVNIVTGTDNGDIDIWNALTGQLIETIPAHTSTITSIEWSPNGNQIASAGADNTIKIWDAWTGLPLLTLQGHANIINNLVWSPDSSRLASASNDGTVRIWDAATGEQISIFQYEGRVYTVDWSPTGDYVVFGGSSSDGQDATAEIEFVGMTEGFTLLDAANNTITNPFRNDSEIDLSALPSSRVKFRANTNPATVGSVKINLDGTEQIDNTAPYEFEWTPVIGVHTLIATPYSGADGSGTAGITYTINFSVINSQ
jgi:WD40 repeat protein